MEHAEYVAKLQAIRDQLREEHQGYVARYPHGNPREELGRILSSYASLRQIEEILQNEERKG